jgi:hypothetical protein
MNRRELLERFTSAVICGGVIYTVPIIQGAVRDAIGNVLSHPRKFSSDGKILQEEKTPSPEPKPKDPEKEAFDRNWHLGVTVLFTAGAAIYGAIKKPIYLTINKPADREP